jgi:tetratricopeptide (TPR) repeat protein
MAWGLSGWIRIYEGDQDVAIDHFLRALKLSPLDSHSLLSTAGLAFAHFFAQRDEEAQRWAEQGVADSPNNLVTLRILTASLASGGQLERARATANRLLALNPEEKVSTAPIISLLRKSHDRTRLQEFLGLAGIPR